MKLHLTEAAGQSLFTGYGEGYVAVNHQRFYRSIVVAAGHDVVRWEPESFDALTAADFESLLAYKPEIVILGTGDTLRFPHPSLPAPLARAHIGFEVMDTRAACRTYNILRAEERQVLAALIL